jgi:hypothetical protein
MTTKKYFMFENKKGFLVRDLIISGVVFSLVCTIFALMIMGNNGFASNYPQSDLNNPTFQSKYGQSQLTTQTESIELIRNTTLSNEGLTFQGAFNVAFGSTFTAIRVVFSTLNLFSSMTSNIVSDTTGLNINAQIITILFSAGISIICVVLLFVWLSSVARGRL